MTEDQIGILIASILFILVFTPLIIGIIVVTIKDQKNQKQFKNPNENQKNNHVDQQTQVNYKFKITTKEETKTNIPPKVNNTPVKKTEQKIVDKDDDGGWAEFYKKNIEPYQKKPHQNTTQYRQQSQQGKKLPYQLNSSVMTNHEKILYNILAKYCSKNNLVLLSKVRIADFITPIYQPYTREYFQCFNKINCKHIDFLICDPNTIRPMVAIELDDYTHKYNSRKDRDVFVDNVYNSVNLPIIHFWNINESNINVQLNNILGISNTIKV